jgi:hypothetical protein
VGTFSHELVAGPGLCVFGVVGAINTNPQEAFLTGMKTTVSEAEHPLLCEGTRREKGDLALALMITYKDDQAKLKKVRD